MWWWYVAPFWNAPMIAAFFYWNNIYEDTMREMWRTPLPGRSTTYWEDDSLRSLLSYNAEKKPQQEHN